LAGLGSEIQCGAKPIFSLCSTPDHGWLLEGNSGIYTMLEAIEDTSSRSCVSRPLLAPFATEVFEPLVGQRLVGDSEGCKTQ
jgi:hypothetical protein